MSDTLIDYHDIVHSCRLATNCMLFPMSKLYDTWLWFERFIIYPSVRTNSQYDIALFSIDDFDNNYLPKFAKGKKNYQQRYVFKKMVKFFYSITLADDLPFYLKIVTGKGIGVFSKQTILCKNLIGKIVGINEAIDNVLMLTKLEQFNHPSLMSVTSSNTALTSPHSILYGPLQYCNHECVSSVGFGRKDWTHILNFSLSGRIHKITGYQIKYNTKRSYIKDEEIVICYNTTDETLGKRADFVCICKVCKDNMINNSSYSSSSSSC